MPDADFYKDRHKFLGASEVAQVMGLSPFSSALDVYHRKMGVQQPTLTSEAMDRGNRQEQFVLNKFAEHVLEIDRIRKAERSRRQHPC